MGRFAETVRRLGGFRNNRQGQEKRWGYETTTVSRKGNCVMENVKVD